jgi:O-acetylhomoserine (thiol)-lyase
MDTPSKPPATSDLLHSDRQRGTAHGALHEPIHTSVQYGFARTADLIGTFQGTNKSAFSYARQGTPTTAALEAKVTKLEQGTGTVCFATGMAAVSAVFLTLLKEGDHLVASQFLFGNTNSLLGTLEGLGIAVSLVDATSVNAVAQALRPTTRMVFVETIANPRTQVPDLAGIGALCRERGLLYVVDNTITSPALFRPKDVGAGLVVNSLSKTLAGHGAALGGAVTDTGRFDWRTYPNISASYLKLDAPARGLQQIRKKGLRDMGGSLSSDAAHRISLGLDTLSLRVQRTSDTALALARFLEAHPAVGPVYYPGLESHPQHAIAARHFAANSWLLGFELRDASQTEAVLDRLCLAIKATGLGDTRTLVIPVAPTIYYEAGPEVRQSMGIADGLVRVSIGLEEADELIADFLQALAG